MLTLKQKAEFWASMETPNLSLILVYIPVAVSLALLVTLMILVLELMSLARDNVKRRRLVLAMDKTT